MLRVSALTASTLCDEYGIYLIDEANLEAHGSWSLPGDVFKQKATTQTFLESLGFAAR